MKSESLAEILEWDTNFFGKRIGRVIVNDLDAAQLQAVMDWADANQVDCLYFLANADAFSGVRLAEDAGFRFQSLRTTLTHSLANLDALKLPDAEGLLLRPSRENDVDALRPIARQSYTWTRFYNDPHFSIASCEQLYDTWLTKSIHAGFADYVVVAEVDGKPVGYATCNQSKNADTTQGTIELVGVTANFRGQKIGQRVVVDTMCWLQKQGMTSVSVVTQGRNIPAVRFYEHLGFVSTEIQMWYHWWRTDKSDSL